MYQGRFGMESLELYNNIIYAANPGTLVVFHDHPDEARIKEWLALGGINEMALLSTMHPPGTSLANGPKTSTRSTLNVRSEYGSSPGPITCFRMAW